MCVCVHACTCLTALKRGVLSFKGSTKPRTCIPDCKATWRPSVC